MDIPYHTEAKILGFHIKSKVQESAHKSCTITTARTRAQAQDAYYRDLSLDKRIRYVHDYLMARVWYLAQMYPPPDECVRQLNTTISWYVRLERGNLPLTLVHPEKEKRRGRMGPYTHNCQELCIISIPSASARTTIRNTNS